MACSVLFLFRPILLELGDAIRVDGASVSVALPAGYAASADTCKVRLSLESDIQDLGPLRCGGDIDRRVS